MCQSPQEEDMHVFSHRMKKLTQRAQQVVSETRKPPSAEDMFLAMLAVVAMQVYCASAASFRACVPQPPLLHPMGWGDNVNI